MRTTKPHVKRWRWGGETTKWVVDGIPDENKKRHRKFFPSRDAANEWLALRRPELKNQGRAAMGLTDTQRVDAVRALAILAPYGTSLTVAAEEFAERAKRLSRTVKFDVLRAEVVAAKRSDRLSDRYLNDLKNRLAKFGETFDARPVATIEARELNDWLRGLALSPTSRFNYRKVLMTTFEFAVERGYARDNPVVKTARGKVDHADPGILSPKEMRALLNAADPSIVPAVALAAFAGLRDAEISRMTWDRIDLAGGHVKVDAAIAKTSSRRIIPISDNLRAWLAPFAQERGPVRPSWRVSYDLFRDARKAASIALNNVGGAESDLLANWPNNALRHSFASYRMALVTNAAQVAEECGHSVQVMKTHYRELVTKVEAEAWFAVAPEKADPNVIVFKNVAAG
jgi:integrase